MLYEKNFWKAFNKKRDEKCLTKKDNRVSVPKLTLSPKGSSKTFQKLDTYKKRGSKLGKDAGARWVMLYGECTDVCRRKEVHAIMCDYCKQTYYKCAEDDCFCYEEGRSNYENYSSSDSDPEPDPDSDSDPDYDSDPDPDPDSDSDYEDVDYNK